MPEAAAQAQGSASASAPQPNRAKSRYATSCTECRRRKQKCSQGQPCTNCLRRFPQTTCEYAAPAAKRRTSNPSAAKSPEVKVVVEGPAYSHLDLNDIQDAILLVEGQSGQVTKSSPREARLSFETSSDVSSQRSLLSPEGSQNDENEKPDEPFKIILRDSTGILQPQSVLALVRMILQVRVNVASRVVNDEWSVDGEALLRAARTATRPPALQMSTFDQQLRNLPMNPSKLNVELVRVYLQLLSRFKAAIDGNPDPESRFMKQWVPSSIKDPLLLQVVLYTSACFLNETGQVPKVVVILYKSAVHRMINEHIQNARTKPLSNEAIMGTAQMVMDSWYWGTTTEMRAHMDGLRQMVKIRGGPQTLGLQGFIAKTILINDAVIALAHEIPTSMFGNSGFEFRDDFMMPHQASFNSPLLFDYPPFSHSSTSALKFHPLTAQILDDVRALFKVVLDLPHDIPTEQVQEVTQYATQTLEKISSMPAHVILQEPQPETRTSPGSSNITPNSSPPERPPSGAPDLMYTIVRKVALIYCRAIEARKPLSDSCEPSEFMAIWGIAWEISLAKWQPVLGLYIWIMVSIVPSGHSLPMARFSKMLTVTAFMAFALENWHLGVDIADNALRLQRWLEEGWSHLEKGVIGGEQGVEQYGFPVKEDLPAVATGQFEDETDIMGGAYSH